LKSDSGPEFFIAQARYPKESVVFKVAGRKQKSNNIEAFHQANILAWQPKESSGSDRASKLLSWCEESVKKSAIRID